MKAFSMKFETLEWPSFGSFTLVWIAISVVTWALVCLLALLFMYRLLHAGLVPMGVLLPLTLLPILLVTLIVQASLFLAARRIRRDDPKANKKLVLLWTPVVTWICLLVLIMLAGGPDAFVPRL
jgi:Mn2+/Fe2+ NRAMP family transporter